jgi:hypothetical protein
VLTSIALDVYGTLVNPLAIAEQLLVAGGVYDLSTQQVNILIQ